MTVFLKCDHPKCISPDKVKIDGEEVTLINLREVSVFDNSNLEEKTGWTTSKGQIHICKDCNDFISMIDQTKKSGEKSKEQLEDEEFDRKLREEPIRVQDGAKKNSEKPSMEVIGDTNGEMNIIDRVYYYLKEIAPRGISPKDLANQLDEDYGSISVSLQRLKERNQVNNPNRGEWKYHRKSS